MSGQLIIHKYEVYRMSITHVYNLESNVFASTSTLEVNIYVTAVI